MPLYMFDILNSDGFTLIEIVIILSLISILAIFTGQVLILTSKHMIAWEHQLKVNNELKLTGQIINDDLSKNNKIMINENNELILTSKKDSITYTLKDSIFIRKGKLYSSVLTITHFELYLYHGKNVRAIDLLSNEDSERKHKKPIEYDYVEYKINFKDHAITYLIEDAIRSKPCGWQNE